VVGSNGCATRDNLCQYGGCPQYFYFEVSRTGSGDYYSGSTKYYFWTLNKTMDNTQNGYASTSSGMPSYSSTPSPSPNSNVYYRTITNFCKLCDFRCMICNGPSNYNCSVCVNYYWKWTNATVCESYCPLGQFKMNLVGTYPDSQTKCALCDSKCVSCIGYNNNCTSCQGSGGTCNFTVSMAGYLYTYGILNMTCLSSCPTSSTPLTTKGYYGSVSTMTCYVCPGYCSNCNINYMKTNCWTLQNVACGGDPYCSAAIQCTDCLTGYALVSGKCVV